MPAIARSVASLRIFGDTLIPIEITARIGAAPTWSYRKGDVKQMRSGRELVRKTGMWLIEAPASEPEDLNSQVAELFAQLTQDMAVWRALSAEFEIDLYCGLFMDGTNDGLSLSASTLAALGERGVELGLDVYAPALELLPTGPCPCESGKSYEQCCGAPPEA